MSNFSDDHIRQLIAEKQLIEGADDSRVSACAYEFRPGIVMSTGRDEANKCLRDWTKAPATATDVHRIQPGELVWVRTLEKVRMPTNICAFWWQTSRLSREGLMLVNMSMVEPGYVGRLACLFVNFSDKPVAIDPGTPIAKLVFTQLSSDARNSLSNQFDSTGYDRAILVAAMNHPKTFLDVGDIETQFRIERDNVVGKIEEETQRAIGRIKAEAQTARGENKKEFEKDGRSMMWKVLGSAALGFSLVVAATSFLPWLQGAIKPDLSTEIKRQVDTTLTERLSILSNVDEVEDLRRRIRQLEEGSATND
jgi:deoxycytidine triphosphate deaminase